MSDESEQLIKLVCTLRWPACSQAGTFQKTIGRAVESRANSTTQYQMPAFPVSLLRDADAFEEFCETHLTGLRTQVREPWEFWFNVECDNVVIRRSLPALSTPLPHGPYAADHLTDAHTELRQAADLMWTVCLQSHQVANVQIFKQTGMTVGAIREIYMWLWGIKEEPLTDAMSVDGCLRTSHMRLARNMLEKGDEETAAQHIKIAFDLTPTEASADELRTEFARVAARWDKIVVVKENAVKRGATVAREGVAEWNTILSEKYYREGLIVPITTEVDSLFTSGELDARRQQIRKLSATNPYRRGLELMEKINANLGFVTTELAGMLTEWPLEELRRRLPASAIAQLRRGSLWAPDTRLERLAELSSADIRLVPFAGEVMPYIQTIHACLDDGLPGIMTYALEQLPDT